MGFLRSIRPGIRPDDLRAAASAAPGAVAVGGSPFVLEPGIVAQTGYASPWAQPNHLASVVWSDIFGQRVRRPVSRAEAMRVPAVARARHIICGTIARIPLRGYRGDQVLDGPAAPSWIEQTSGPLSPFHRMVWTTDDQLFFGWSLWWRTNSTYDGFPLRADRVPMGLWSFDSSGNVLVDQRDGQGMRGVSADSVILLPGPHEGLLAFAEDSVRHAADLQRAVHTAARNPAAYIALKQTGGDKMSKDEIDELLDTWAAARNNPERGGVGFLNSSVDAKALGTFDAHLLVEGRNAAAVDIARSASLPADLLDASTGADLTYQNARDNDRRAIDYGVGYYMSALSSALSMDAVTPRGQRVAFDLEQWLEGTVPGQPAKDDGTTPGVVPVAVPAQPVPPTPEPPQ